MTMTSSSPATWPLTCAATTRSPLTPLLGKEFWPTLLSYSVTRQLYHCHSFIASSCGDCPALVPSFSSHVLVFNLVLMMIQVSCSFQLAKFHHYQAFIVSSFSAVKFRNFIVILVHCSINDWVSVTLTCPPNDFLSFITTSSFPTESGQRSPLWILTQPPSSRPRMKRYRPPPPPAWSPSCLAASRRPRRNFSRRAEATEGRWEAAEAAACRGREPDTAGSQPCCVSRICFPTHTTRGQNHFGPHWSP